MSWWSELVHQWGVNLLSHSHLVQPSATQFKTGRFIPTQVAFLCSDASLSPINLSISHPLWLSLRWQRTPKVNPQTSGVILQNIRHPWFPIRNGVSLFWGEAAVQSFYSWYKPSSGFIVGGTDFLSEITFAAFQCESGSKGRVFFWWEYVESELTREPLLWPDLTNYWWSNIPLVVPTSWMERPMKLGEHPPPLWGVIQSDPIVTHGISTYLHMISYMYIYVYLYLSLSLSLYLSLSIYLSIYLYICLSNYLTI